MDRGPDRYICESEGVVKGEMGSRSSGNVRSAGPEPTLAHAGATAPTGSRAGSRSELDTAEAARATLSEATARLEPTDRDMRSKRPPALSFLLRMSTARRLARVLSLLALDFVAVSLGDLHGARDQGGGARPRRRESGARRNQADPRLCLPRNRAAVRALGPVRRARAAPGLSQDRGGAVPGRVVRAAVRRREGEHFSSLYIHSGARWASRCCTCPRCGARTSG